MLLPASSMALQGVVTIIQDDILIILGPVTFSIVLAEPFSRTLLRLRSRQGGEVTVSVVTLTFTCSGGLPQQPSRQTGEDTSSGSF